MCLIHNNFCPSPSTPLSASLIIIDWSSCNDLFALYSVHLSGAAFSSEIGIKVFLFVLFNCLPVYYNYIYVQSYCLKIKLVKYFAHHFCINLYDLGPQANLCSYRSVTLLHIKIDLPNVVPIRVTKINSAKIPLSIANDF